MTDYCQKVVMSSKAYLAVIAETYEKVRTETGGIFLGKRLDDTWYIIEALDPGPNSIFRQSYFEYDTPYVNHLANKVARFYKERVELIGLWHRHPGSFDSFSSTDDQTNTEYASQNSYGAISALVNLDPNFRITIYHVSLPLKYIRIPVDYGDELIPKQLLLFKTAEDFLRAAKSKSIESYQLSSNRQHLNFAQPFNSQAPTSQAKTSTKNNVVTSFGKAMKSIYNNVFASSHPSQPTQNTVSEASNSMPIQEQLLLMLDSEMDYLEAQEEYEYTMSMKEDRIVLLLKHIKGMPHRPHILDCILSVSENKQICAINGYKYDYTPGIIRKYIKKSESNTAGF